MDEWDGLDRINVKIVKNGIIGCAGAVSGQNGSGNRKWWVDPPPTVNNKKCFVHMDSCLLPDGGLLSSHFG